MQQKKQTPGDAQTSPGVCFLLVAKATTSYASGKEELVTRKEADKIKTPY